MAHLAEKMERDKWKESTGGEGMSTVRDSTKLIRSHASLGRVGGKDKMVSERCSRS